ncbi:biliverdin-producing heme oxygenase [Planctomyces sp. SH-PL62]|uniref:biliverdin-producing heme oxygenase n=1 Tax=Planctomyces sp. SH-PL62 TaxID=1636152 RepID=UPI00078DF534|nr:biliverdin-producing heme oxygenase [Planctomyces sp. SH-PL62]AMV36505.1 Heme oxygenase [Planctomyces sp. SH-PL62]
MMMSRLKEATRPHHEAIEARLDFFKLSRSIEGYTRVLRRFHGFHRPAEEAFDRLSGWAAVGIDPAERRKTPLLKDDLKILGLDEAAIDVLPVCPTLPPLSDLPEAIGLMYVLEGSTLGGQYIRKRVEATLGLTPGRGCSYFASYGDRVGPMWKAFSAAVDAFATSEPAREAIARSAVASFGAIDAWFAEDAPGAR